MSALDTAMDEFAEAIRKLNSSRETADPKPNKRDQLPPAIRAHIAQQRQLVNVLYDIAADMGKAGVYATLTLKEADRIFMNAAVFEAQEIDRLG